MQFHQKNRMTEIRASQKEKRPKPTPLPYRTCGSGYQSTQSCLKVSKVSSVLSLVDFSVWISFTKSPPFDSLHCSPLFVSFQCVQTPCQQTHGDHTVISVRKQAQSAAWGAVISIKVSIITIHMP